MGLKEANRLTSTENLSRKEKFALDRQYFVSERTQHHLDRLTSSENHAQLQKIEEAFQIRERMELTYGRSLEDWKTYVCQLLAQMDFGLIAAHQKFNKNNPFDINSRVQYREILVGDPHPLAYEMRTQRVWIYFEYILLYASKAFFEEKDTEMYPRTGKPTKLEDRLFFIAVEEYAHHALNIVKGFKWQIAAPSGMPENMFSEAEIRANRWIAYFDRLLEEPYGATEVSRQMYSAYKNHNKAEYKEILKQMHLRNKDPMRKILVRLLNLMFR